MMAAKRTVTWGIALSALLFSVLAGCATSSPNVKEAETALEEEDHETALSSIERALKEDSADTDAYLLRATVLRRMADSSMGPDEYRDLHSRAREAEEKALSFDSTLLESVQNTRKTLYEREFRKGQSAYNRANKNKNEDLYRQAVSFFGAARIAQSDSARSVLNEAFARLQLGQRADVIPILEEYLERADTASRDAYKILGQLYWDRNENGKAMSLLEEATDFFPEDQELQALRLNASNRAGKMDRALEVYRKQVEENPEEVAYRYNYGALLLKAERYSEAIDQLRAATEIQPSHVDSQYNLGAAYVNAALARDDSIAVLEAGGNDVEEASGDREQRIEDLVQKREELFRKAIPPLERARKMENDAESTIQRDACRALLVAYVQTNRPSKAAQVEDCTGFSEAGV